MLAFAFFFASSLLMQNMVWQGLQVKLRNVGNLLSYHVTSLYSMANTSNAELTLSKEVGLPQTLENRVVYGLTVFQDGNFSVLELYTISTQYVHNMQLPRISAQITLPTNIRVESVPEIVPLTGSQVLITCAKNGSGITVSLSQAAT